MPGQPRSTGQAAYGAVNGVLDEVNVRLIAQLRADPRMSMSALARAVGMSAPAVTERVQRLEQAGVIAGYRLDLDPAAFGLPVVAFVRLRTHSGRLAAFAEFVSDVPEVVECHRITGEDCFLIKVRLPAVDQLARVLDQIQQFGQTTTSVVMDTPVEPRTLPLLDSVAAVEVNPPERD